MHVIGWLLHMERERMHLEGGRDEGTCKQTRGGENRRESAKKGTKGGGVPEGRQRVLAA